MGPKDERSRKNQSKITNQMKKAILKSTLAVVAVTASCLGAWKAYGAYGAVDNSLMMENIEALSGDNNGEPNDGVNGEAYLSSTILWKNSHVHKMNFNQTLRKFVLSDSVKGESKGALFASDDESIRSAKKQGYGYTKHIHDYKICNVNLGLLN